MSENSNNLITIPGRLHAVSIDGVVSGADEIWDDAKGKRQSEINEEHESSITAEVERATQVEELLQSEISGFNSQNYVSVDSYSELPELGSVDTVYRVGSWDGTQVDVTKYAEYAWKNTGIDQGEYVLLSVKDYGIDEEPTAGSDNLVKSGGVYDFIGHLIIYDGDFIYQASDWEQQRRFFQKNLNYGPKVVINSENATNEEYTILVTFDDNSTKTIAFNNGTLSETIDEEGKTIKQLYAYFSQSKRPDGSLKIIANYSLSLNTDANNKARIEFNGLKSDISPTTFIKSENKKVRGFFKELYIVPKYPGQIDINTTSVVSIYRNYNGRWYISFFESSDQVALAVFDVTGLSPEGEQLIELVDRGSSNQRFTGYALVDWSQLEEGERIIYEDCHLKYSSLNVKYSPIINYTLITEPLIKAGYLYKGVVEDAAIGTIPTPTGKEFYLATGTGTYTNIGNLTVPYGNIGILKYDSSWSLDLVNLNAYIGKVEAYNGTMSKTAAGENWESVRKFYHLFSPFGRFIKVFIENSTGSQFTLRVDFEDGTTQNFTIGSSETEKIIQADKNIKFVYMYFSSSAEPEGNLKVDFICSNSYGIYESYKNLTRHATSSVVSGGNLAISIPGDYRINDTYIIKISGNIDDRLVLRGVYNNVATELGYVKCGCTYRKTIPTQFTDIRVVKNNMSESGSVEMSIVGADLWEALVYDNNTKLSTCGLENEKDTFKTGFNCEAEVVGEFKAEKEYEIELNGVAQNTNFILFLFDLEGNEIYRSTSYYNVGRTYIFKCPNNAKKLSFVRNNLTENVTLKVNIKEASTCRALRETPNYIGIPIAAHQGNTVGGQTIGSPNAWLAAQRYGYKWIECDIQFTSDDIAVFLHDNPINVNGNYVVSKEDGTPVDKNDNIKVSSLTYRELKDTYRWADGGEILSLVEGFGFLNMLGINAVLEFKAYPDNDNRCDYLKKACMVYGIERIIYNATSTDYKVIFPSLINLGIYRRGEVSLTSSSESEVEAAFAYAAQIGNACVSIYGISGGDIDTEFAQRMVDKYQVPCAGLWGKNTLYQTALVVSDDIAPVKDYYGTSLALVSNRDITYADYTNIGTITLQDTSNVNLSMIADENVIVRISGDRDYYGCVNIARILASGSYNIFAKGTGHISNVMVRY